jgi:dolichyl-diphosphooligosaccharide--protein glycosyltransferase/undecaprenyl-diphosphooligosaccharide--protein glycosyltransferase
MKQNRLSLDNISTKQMIGLMVLAYAFSFLIRMIWVWQFKDTSSFYWNGQLMINTNDGYFFASGVQKALEGLHQYNPRVFGIFDYGVIFITTLLVKFTSMSIETAILYAPAIFSSLVVIPIILIARLYNNTLWGFFAALLGSITWSYYNRTMTGYYDTDMFSAMAPMFILFFLIKSTLDFNLRSALYASIAIVIYPFLYDQGLAIVYAIGIIYGAYMVWFHRDSKVTYSSLILVFIALLPLHHFIDIPYNYIVHIILLIGLYIFFKKDTLEKEKLIVITGVVFFLFLVLGNVFGLIWTKITSYTISGTEDGSLHFYAVNQTVREAGRIPFETFANRTSGSIVGVIIALIGYVLLVIKHRAFILALPLIGIGVFSLWGGLRFTVYAVPVAAMSAVYLFWFIAEKFIEEKKAQIVFVAILTAGMIYPNIMHIIGYKVPTVMNKMEVSDLDKLNKIASPKDYTLTWWDYGYPIWFYSDTSTLIDGGKHNNDNFIISKILFSTSPEQVANLSRLAVETYVDSNYSVVANKIFTTKKNPKILLNDLKKPDFKLPPKTRDIYLYMPYRMMNIFPTIGVFGNLDLMTGRKERQIVFYPTSAVKQAGSKIIFRNGIVFDSAKGILRLGKSIQKVYCFDQVRLDKNFNPVVQSSIFHIDGNFCIVNLQDYGRVIIMDRKTYNSAYVQMFMLGKYDKKLFDLVVSSPYTKIFKIKK